MSKQRFCVFGNPIAHSRSPDIHAHFAKQFDLDIRYDKTLVELGGFAEAATAFFEAGGCGANVTVPFKEDAFRFADELSERAKLAGALNTLMKMDDGRIYGDTTDGSGLVWDLTERLGWALAGKRLLILGAGGAATSVISDLLNHAPESITVANRTVSKANAVARKYSHFGSVLGAGLDELLQVEPFHVVINATSASLSGELPAIPEALLGPGLKVYDMVYSDAPTRFLQFAQRCGVSQYADGFGMLIGQAAASFHLWLKQRPDCVKTMRDLRR